MQFKKINIICHNCNNAKYMTLMTGNNVGEFNIKCFNCNHYFKYDDLVENNSEENMRRLHDWCAMHGIIYVQWYPYDNCSGYYIENPSEDALEKFYENVNASDPYHKSFVLILGQTETAHNLNMRTIDEYIQYDILPFLFC